MKKLFTVIYIDGPDNPRGHSIKVLAPNVKKITNPCNYVAEMDVPNQQYGSVSLIKIITTLNEFSGDRDMGLKFLSHIIIEADSMAQKSSRLDSKKVIKTLQSAYTSCYIRLNNIVGQKEMKQFYQEMTKDYYNITQEHLQQWKR